MSWGSLLWILEGKVPIPCKDTIEWGQWMHGHFKDRVVCQQDVDNLWVSTVFVGVDQNHFPSDEPLLFETMIKKNGDWLNYIERTSTWELAIEQHARAVAWAIEEQMRASN